MSNNDINATNMRNNDMKIKRHINATNMHNNDIKSITNKNLCD